MEIINSMASSSSSSDEFTFTLLPSPSTPHDTPPLLLFPVCPQNPAANSERKTLILNPNKKTDPAVSLDLSLSIASQKTMELPQPDSPWKIKKFLTASDLRNLSRLTVASVDVQKHIIPSLGPEDFRNLLKGEGLQVRMRDCDTNTEHGIVLKKSNSNGTFVFNGTWMQSFVKRRGLKLGDQIGLFWDRKNSRVNFSLLKRA